MNMIQGRASTNIRTPCRSPQAAIDGTVRLMAMMSATLSATLVTASLARGQQTLYGNSLANPSRLYRIENPLTAPTAVDIGSMNVNAIADIAADRVSGAVFAVNDVNIFSVSVSTAAATIIGPHGLPPGSSSLEVAPDGTIYLAHFANTNLYRVNRMTGQAVLLFPTGRFFRGDIAHDPVTGDLLGLVINGSGTALVRINLSTQVTTQVGPGFPGIYTGLEITQTGEIIAASGANPNVARLDRLTGMPTVIGTLGGNFGAGLALLEPVCPAVATNPSDGSTCRSGTATFSVTAAGSGPLSYQWQVRGGGVACPWVNLVDGPNTAPCGGLGFITVAGVQTAAIDVTDERPAFGDPHLFRCIVTNSCGSVTSNPATLTVCVADTDDGSGMGVCDGGITIDDLLYYLFIFENGDLASDVDDGSSAGTPDGGVTIDDLLYYLQRFEAGC